MSKSHSYNPNAYNRRVARKRRGILFRGTVFAGALVLVSWGGIGLARTGDGILSAFTGGGAGNRPASSASSVVVQQASECLTGSGSWEQAPQQMLSSLGQQGRGMMNSVIGNLTSRLGDQISSWVGGMGGVMNLSQTTQQISNTVTSSIKEATNMQMQFEDMIKSKPGGLNMRWCYSEYGDLHSRYGQMLRSNQAGPTSGDWQIGNYYSRMIRSADGISYPDADEGVYSSNPGAYVDKVAKTTMAMGGPGTDLNGMLSRSALQQSDKDRFTGLGQQARALSQINTALATDGADAITYSADIWRRMSQFNPDSWDNAYPEQAMKDIPKLLYVTNQLLAKSLRVQGEMAIQQSAIGQTKTGEITQKMFSDFMNINKK